MTNSPTVTPPPSGPPAAWHDDPNGSNRQRWYDGTAWTDQFQGPPVSSRKARDRAVYTRQQKGHSLLLFLLFDWITLYIRTIYYSLSPNHYWHL